MACQETTMWNTKSSMMMPKLSSILFKLQSSSTEKLEAKNVWAAWNLSSKNVKVETDWESVQKWRRLRPNWELLICVSGVSSEQEEYDDDDMDFAGDEFTSTTHSKDAYYCSSSDTSLQLDGKLKIAPSPGPEPTLSLTFTHLFGLTFLTPTQRNV